MGLATLGSFTFRLDPESVEWDYRIKYVDKKTVGGKVVQILGATFGDMRLEGSFGVGGWEEQADFLAKMKALADQQVKDASVVNSSAEPLQFRYPPKGWDFLVYLRAYTNPRGPASVRLATEEFAPRWGLTLFIVEDNTGLRKVAADRIIARLSAGLGWKQTKYNGPMDMTEVSATLAGRGIQGYLQEEFTPGFAPAASTPTGNQTPE